jgi:hypothetical protein
MLGSQFRVTGRFVVARKLNPDFQICGIRRHLLTEIAHNYIALAGIGSIGDLPLHDGGNLRSLGHALRMPQRAHRRRPHGSRTRSGQSSGK